MAGSDRPPEAERRDDDRFARAVAALDAINAEDRARLVVDGQERPRALAHAELATRWVRRLVAEPSEELLLAARGHHLRRWTVPRRSYPSGRAGYLRWRRHLRDLHGREVAAVLQRVGYPEATAERVARIVRRERLRDDPEAQVLEDALCLVFLETGLDELAGRLDDEKMVTVLARTAAKMSPTGRRVVAGLDLGPRGRDLLARAGLGAEDADGDEPRGAAD